MTTYKITRDDFTIPRTPIDLARYVHETYNKIYHTPELKRVARLRRQPYKTFLEELMPFSDFCTWKYGNRDDILCALAQGTLARDGLVFDMTTRIEHSVEITYPVDGLQVVNDGRQLNESGMTYANWDCNDMSKQQAAIELTIKIAYKKSLRNYLSPGGSSLVFVFDHRLFWDCNPKHVELLVSLRSHLSLLNFQADDVLLMLVHGSQRKIIEVKNLNK
ncbi:MAG: hypothetical protein C4581_02165 [Nitrospiraceae bacterium]|nr:MAG: hypothetical protein C4581_02165 [Nitrospiraceae bacterium]